MPCLSDFNHSSCSKKFFFLASFTEENFVLTYWWWHFILSDVNFGGAIFFKLTFCQFKSNEMPILDKIAFSNLSIMKIWYDDDNEMKEILGNQEKKLNYLLLLWTFFAPSTRTWTWNYFKHKYKYTYTWWSQSTLIEEFCMKRVTSRSFTTYKHIWMPFDLERL